MSDFLFTIVVVPRERFSMAKTSLLDLYDKTTGPFPLIYVDGNSPPELAAWLENESKERGFQLMRLNYFIPQHVAYNLTLPFITTKYVLFCDNDVTFSPGWEKHLVECAEETGADAVGPLYLEQIGPATQIHMAGGRILLQRRQDHFVYHEIHFAAHQSVQEADQLPDRRETALIEYHAFLARTDTLKKSRLFDPNLLSAKDHADFSLNLKSAGGRCWITKKAQVTYHVPTFLEKEDRAFYFTRWSERWNKHSYDFFSKKWGISTSLNPWFGQHRRAFLEKITAPLGFLIGWRNARRVYYRLLDPVIALFEPAWNRKFYQKTYESIHESKLGIADLTKPLPADLRPAFPENDDVFKVEN